jgi:hypothetical protein
MYKDFQRNNSRVLFINMSLLHAHKKFSFSQHSSNYVQVLQSFDTHACSSSTGTVIHDESARWNNNQLWRRRRRENAKCVVVCGTEVHWEFLKKFSAGVRNEFRVWYSHSSVVSGALKYEKRDGAVTRQAKHVARWCWTHNHFTSTLHNPF